MNEIPDRLEKIKGKKPFNYTDQHQGRTRVRVQLGRTVNFELLLSTVNVRDSSVVY